MREYLDKSIDESIFDFDIDVNEGDKILSLVTCTRMFGHYNDIEFRVDARLVRNGELKSNYDVQKSKNYHEIEEIMKGGENDEKYSRGIIGVFILFIVAVVAFCSYNILSSRQSANVSKNENLAKTTDGATCNNDEEMNSEYEPKVSFSQGKATITVKKGSFRVTNVTNGQYLTNNPMELGIVTPNKPMEVTFNANASADVELHFVLAETDDTCLSYDEAPLNSSGQKAGTYEFDMTLQLKPQLETPLKDNQNYNGICSVLELVLVMKIIRMSLKRQELVRVILKNIIIML